MGQTVFHYPAGIGTICVQFVAFLSRYVHGSRIADHCSAVWFANSQLPWLKPALLTTKPNEANVCLSGLIILKTKPNEAKEW